MPRAYSRAPSSSRFFVPLTLESDFDNFLDGDIPDTVMDIRYRSDWFDENTEKGCRAEVYPEPTKDKARNADTLIPFRVSKSTEIHKGDMIITSDGHVHICDWHVTKQSNNKFSRMTRCNLQLTLERNFPEEIDEEGYLVSPGGWKPIFEKLPVNIYDNDGRANLITHGSSPGAIPEAVVIIVAQKNPSTDKVRIGDMFYWGKQRYQVIDISRTGIDINPEKGIYRFQANKVAGDFIDD